MANVVYITLKEERNLGFDLEPIKNQESSKIAYICCDEMIAHLGEFNDIQDLEELIGEKNILKSIEENLSEYEAEHILTILECNNYEYQLGYYPCHAILTAKQ